MLVVAGNHDAHEGDDRLDGILPHRCAMLGAAGLDVAGIRVAGVRIERDAGTGAFRWASACLPDAQASVIVSHFPVLSRRPARRARTGLSRRPDQPTRAP
jgi:hypothetical protein